MEQNNRAVAVNPSVLPEPVNAVRQMESQGSHLTNFSPFGRDPLEGHATLIQLRDDTFKARFPDFNNFFHTTVNGDFSSFRIGLLFIIEVSKRLESQIV